MSKCLTGRNTIVSSIMISHNIKRLSCHLYIHPGMYRCNSYFLKALYFQYNQERQFQLIFHMSCWDDLVHSYQEEIVACRIGILLFTVHKYNSTKTVPFVTTWKEHQKFQITDARRVWFILKMAPVKRPSLEGKAIKAQSDKPQQKNKKD